MSAVNRTAEDEQLVTADDVEPIARRLTKRALRGIPLGGEREEIIRAEARSLAYLLAEAASTRLEDVRAEVAP